MIAKLKVSFFYFECNRIRAVLKIHQDRCMTEVKTSRSVL